MLGLLYILYACMVLIGPISIQASYIVVLHLNRDRYRRRTVDNVFLSTSTILHRLDSTPSYYLSPYSITTSIIRKGNK